MPAWLVLIAGWSYKITFNKELRIHLSPSSLRSAEDGHSRIVRARFEDGNDGFLALLGNDGESDLALLDVENRVGNLSL